ncbi:MAG: peptide chain release factor N(5)-glutamine methyltransferase [Polyangiaceae bacterium]|nr:peptide chain release factor N(5)-glutamine methyltransferase [Polyangiaceae bacterium]
MTSAAQPKTGTKAWTIGSLVQWATDDFRARCIENPRLDAELLVAFALGTDRMRVILDADRPLDPSELARLRDLVVRRRDREPIAYLRGEREFFGLRFRVDKRVLVPRPDTETLVDVGLRRTLRVSLSMRQLDLCTGSGCVAIAMAHKRRTAKVFAVDVSLDALEVARANAQRLGVYNVAFFDGDLFSPAFPWAFDLITANPPYIPTAEIDSLMPDVKNFEPRIALDGGSDGLDVVRRIVAEAPAHLARGGVLALEIGAGQAPTVTRLFAEQGFCDIETARDFAKIERVVSAIWKDA